MSENDLSQIYEDGNYTNYLPKRFTSTRQKPSQDQNKIEQVKKQEKSAFINTKTYSPQTSQYTQIGLENNTSGQHNLSHFFVREYQKSNTNTPIRNKSAQNSQKILRNTFEYSPYKQMKQNVFVKNIQDYTSKVLHNSLQSSKKNISNLSFMSQMELDKSRRVSMACISTQQDDQEDGKNLISKQKMEINQIKKKLLKTAFSNSKQRKKNIDENKGKTDDLMNDLVIKSIKPKSLFTNSLIAKTQQILNNQDPELNKQQTTQISRQKIINNSNRIRPQSQCISKRKLPYSGMQQTEKQLLNYLQGTSQNNSFTQIGVRNETSGRDTRIANLSFYADDMKNSKIFYDTTKTFYNSNRPKTAQLSNRSSLKSQSSQISPQINIYNQRLSISNQNSFNLDLDKDIQIQIQGKRSQILSPPKNQRKESKSDINQDKGKVNVIQDQLNDIEQKLQEGFMSPAINRTTIYNRNVLKKHHFVKNVVDISLFEKNKKVEMKQFVFDTSSPEKRKSVTVNLNNEFFTSESCVELFN